MRHPDSEVPNLFTRWLLRLCAPACALAVILTTPALKAEGPGEFPPSPFDTATFADRVPESDRALQIPAGSSYLTPVSTNQSELALLEEIRTLQTNLVALETAAYAEIPELKVYDQYLEVAHDWVMQHHREEFGASLRYFGSSGPGDAGTRRQLVELIDMALYKELASNTNFAPLLRDAFEAAASRSPSFFGTAYARADALLGSRPAHQPTVITNFEAYVAEYDKRYDKVQAKLEAIQREKSVPAEALAGQRWGDMYRLLSSCAQMYVELRTPEPLVKLRQELRRKYIDLSQLRAALPDKPH